MSSDFVGTAVATNDNVLTLKAQAGATVTLTGSQDLTYTNGGAVTQTIKAGSDFTGELNVTGAGVVDTIIAGSGGSTITGKAGNDIITLGTGVDKVVFTLDGSVAGTSRTNNGVDSISHFGADDVLSFGAVVTKVGATVFDTKASAGAISWNMGDKNVLELAFDLDSALSLDADTDGTNLLAALTAKSSVVTPDTASEKGVMVVYDAGNAYLYQIVNGTDVALAAEDIALVGVLNNVTVGALDTGNIDFTAII